MIMMMLGDDVHHDQSAHGSHFENCPFFGGAIAIGGDNNVDDGGGFFF